MNKEAQKLFSVPLILMMVISASFLIVSENASANTPPVANAEPKYQTVITWENAWFSANGSYDPDGWIVSYDWDFGDGGYGSGFYVEHAYTTPGDYVVMLTVTDDGNATGRDNVNVTVLQGPGGNAPPVAVAYPDHQTVMTGEDAWFYGGYSYDPDGYIIIYNWDFGDGNFGSGLNITHQYMTPGTYTVILTVIDNYKASDSDNCTVDVTGTSGNLPPIADANPDFQSVFVDEDAFFSGNMSYDPDGNITDYLWNFGDGNSASGMDVSHKFTTPGDYSVTLIVTDNEGATNSDKCVVKVQAPPIPSPPTNLDANLVQGSLSDVRLTWTGSADDGSGNNNVAGYTVYKSATGIYGLYLFEAWIPAQGIPSHSYEWTDFGAGDGDWNNYFYIVRTNDTFGNEEQNSNKVGKFVSLLDSEWNMISVPLVQKDTKRETVLQTIEGNYVTVQGYHAGKSRPWLHWHRNKPNMFNDVIAIDHKNGYYVDMLVPDHLVTAGKVAEQTDINLKTGWNLIGFPKLENTTVETALSSIAGKYNMVEYYDTASDKEVRLNPDDQMFPGLGYWIHTTEDCVLTLTN